MLCLSQTTGYAILALSCLDGGDSRRMLAKDIAACTGIPLPYLSKIMYALSLSGLVSAKRGYRGGFMLGQPPDTISLLDVAEAVEGESWSPRCLLGLAECSDQRACPTHGFWKAERKRIENELRRITLKDVAEFERKSKFSRLKIDTITHLDKEDSARIDRSRSGRPARTVKKTRRASGSRP